MSPAFDVPRARTRAIERSRLVDALGRGDDRPALAIVQGQAGSGKSTALAQWSRSLPLEHENLVWIALRSDDSGVLSFWKHVGDSLARARLLDENIQLDASAGDFATMLLGTLAGLELPLTLVLDDYHLVASEPIDGQLRLLLERLDGLRLVLGTRTSTGLHSLELAARVNTVIVNAEMLAFTIEESRALVASGQLANRRGLADEIYRATQGWPLASQALIIEAQRDAHLSGLLSESSPGSPGFAREFASSALGARESGEQDFLLRVSLADECTVELASELTGCTVAETKALLDALEYDGIGTWQTRSATLWFGMHPLLREAFEEEATALLPQEVLERVRGAISDQVHRDRPLKALQLAFSIGDWARMERLTLLHWHGFNYYDRAPYGQLLKRIPKAALRSHPALMAAELVEDSNNMDSLQRITRSFSQLGTAMRQRNAATGVVGALAEIMYAGTHRIMGDMPTALAKVELAQRVLNSADASDRDLNAPALSVLHAHAAITRLFDRQHASAMADIASAHALAVTTASASEQFQALALGALIQSVRGDIRDAREWLRRCEEAAPYDGWIGGYLQAGYHIAKATAALQRWDAPAAFAALEALSPTEPLLEHWPLIAVARARADLLTHGPSEAYAALTGTIARKRLRPRPVPALRAQLTAMAAQLLLLDGQAGRAASTIQASGLADEPEVALVSARLASLRGDHGTAVALADAVAWSSEDSPVLRAEALLTIASSAYDAGQPDRALAAFVNAVATMARHDLRTPLLWVGSARLGKLAALASDAGLDLAENVVDGVPELGRNPSRVLPLSRAERRVLQTLRDTGDVAVVAEQLHITEGTVRYHLKRSYRKLGVSSRAKAIALAQDLGML